MCDTASLDVRHFLDVGTVESRRCLVRATATRWVADEPFPGIVEVQFAQHDGSLVTIHEKCAVIDGDPTKTTSYPAEVLLQAEMVAAGTSAGMVRLLHGVEDAAAGRTSFTVSLDLIVTTLH
jgi:hypothetical protein